MRSTIESHPMYGWGAKQTTPKERGIEGGFLYDGTGLTLGDIVALEQPDIEDMIHLQIGFWNAFDKLAEQDAAIISQLMRGFKYKDISETIHNARYRIRLAKKRFENELDKEGISIGGR